MGTTNERSDTAYTAFILVSCKLGNRRTRRRSRARTPSESVAEWEPGSTVGAVTFAWCWSTCSSSSSCPSGVQDIDLDDSIFEMDMTAELGQIIDHVEFVAEVEPRRKKKRLYGKPRRKIA